MAGCPNVFLSNSLRSVSAKVSAKSDDVWQSYHAQLSCDFGHTTRHESSEKDIMLGIMPGKRRQGGQKKQRIDDIVQWGDRSPVEMVRQAENRKGYRCLVHEAAYARTSGTVS